MNIIGYLYLAIFGFVFYIVLKSKYKTSKRKEIKYDEYTVQIPEHLCSFGDSDDEELTFEEMESYCENYKKDRSEKLKYKIVKWDDIKSWEYEYVRHSNFNHTIYLYITITEEIISVTDVQHLMKMKRYFKKYAKNKQIHNFSNTMEYWRYFFSFVTIGIFVYLVFFRY